MIDMGGNSIPWPHPPSLLNRLWLQMSPQNKMVSWCSDFTWKVKCRPVPDRFTLRLWRSTRLTFLIGLSNTFPTTSSSGWSQSRATQRLYFENQEITVSIIWKYSFRFILNSDITLCVFNKKQNEEQKDGDKCLWHHFKHRLVSRRHRRWRSPLSSPPPPPWRRAAERPSSRLQLTKTGRWALVMWHKHQPVALSTPALFAGCHGYRALQVYAESHVHSAHWLAADAWCLTEVSSMFPWQPGF